MGFVDYLASQPWYMTATNIVGGLTMVTMWISDKWADKVPVIKQINMVMNWLSGNLFFNKNK